MKSSQLNQRFRYDSYPFETYIKQMRRIVASTHHYTSDKEVDTIDLNSPFEWKPEGDPNPEHGILLIHGLFDSPFCLRDVANKLVEQGYWVRALLLPGHGTVADDLLHIHFEEWVKTVKYAIEGFASHVKQLSVAGYSLGGTLALHHAVLHPDTLHKLILFAPGIKPKSPLSMIAHLPGMSYVSRLIPWYKRWPQRFITRYLSLATNAGYQACQLMRKTRHLLKEAPLSMPIFVVSTTDDETISHTAIKACFMAQKNKQNRLLVYGDEDTTSTNMIIRSSQYPEENVINFSHTSLSVAPNNPVFGKQGCCLELQLDNKDNGKPIARGALTRKNMRKFRLERLNYNPDFVFMLNEVLRFLSQ